MGNIMMTSLKTASLWVGSQYTDVSIGYGNYNDKFENIIIVGGVTIQGYEDRLWKLS